jgi:RNA polymerase sigma factor (sigma-70 family)
MAISPEASALALNRAILCVDIEGFAALQADSDRLAARDALYRAFDIALAKAGAPRQGNFLEDRGDGVLVVVPPEVPSHLLLTVLPNELAAVLEKHNRNHPPRARIRLRLVIHTGEVHYDEHGVAGEAIDLAFRILDSRPLKQALASSPADLALIVSDQFFRDVLELDAALDPGAYRREVIRARGTRAVAWIRLYPDPHLEAQRTVGHDLRHASTHGDRPGAHPGADDFDEFYLRNFRLVRNIVNTRAQDWALAEEVTDEAMAIAYRKWEELHEHPSPVGFVIVTARRILSRTQRQRARKNPPVHPLSLEAGPGLELKAVGAGPDDIAVNRADLKQALHDLPADQRECFVLYEILGYPIREIANHLNLPEGTVKTRLRAARQALRELLSDNLGKEGGQ